MVRYEQIKLLSNLASNSWNIGGSKSMVFETLTVPQNLGSHVEEVYMNAERSYQLRDSQTAL